MESKNFELAKAKIEPLLKSKEKALERFKEAEKLTQLDKQALPRLKEARRDLKNGYVDQAALKLAPHFEDSKMAEQLMEMDHSQKALLKDLAEMKAKESDSGLKRELEEAIQDGKRGKVG